LAEETQALAIGTVNSLNPPFVEASWAIESPPLTPKVYQLISPSTTKKKKAINTFNNQLRSKTMSQEILNPNNHYCSGIGDPCLAWPDGLKSQSYHWESQLTSSGSSEYSCTLGKQESVWVGSVDSFYQIMSSWN
jgi:hypothetical protein